MKRRPIGPLVSMFSRRLTNIERGEPIVGKVIMSLVGAP